MNQESLNKIKKNQSESIIYHPLKQLASTTSTYLYFLALNDRKKREGGSGEIKKERETEKHTISWSDFLLDVKSK